MGLAGNARLRGAPGVSQTASPSPTADRWAAAEQAQASLAAFDRFRVRGDGRVALWGWGAAHLVAPEAALINSPGELSEPALLERFRPAAAAGTALLAGQGAAGFGGGLNAGRWAC